MKIDTRTLSTRVSNQTADRFCELARSQGKTPSFLLAEMIEDGWDEITDEEYELLLILRERPELKEYVYEHR